MPEERPDSRRIVNWYQTQVRPVLQKTEQKLLMEDLDRMAGKIQELDANLGQRFPICLLGQAGVGKSTLLNTLIADSDIVVPSGGGNGPLTANALHVMHGDRPRFEVTYHSATELNQTRFIIESEIQRQDRTTSVTENAETQTEEFPNLKQDSEDDKKSRTEEAIFRARLLVTGAQKEHRELTYLADALRWILDQNSRFESVFHYQGDIQRLKEVRNALSYARSGIPRRFDSDGQSDFGHRLRDHASGFLAPLIREMKIQWPSELLRNSLEMVDLPGIGILSDVYASVTSDYLRNRAKAVMLVADSRGLRREDAETLKTSGFLNRLLHASDDLTADPVALFVVAVKIDDVAVENWRNDKSLHGTAQKSKVQHFAELVARCRAEMSQQLRDFLQQVWEVDSDGKRQVIESILKSLQVFPVSAPQYRLCLADDSDEERPFLPDVEATNIPSLRQAIAEVAARCAREQHERTQGAALRFFGLLRARLKVLSAQYSDESRAEEEVSRFKAQLEEFLAPRQREFDNRRGAFRNFLRKTIPSQIGSRVESASNKARTSINGVLRSLRNAHWKTLQAAVRREGTFHGSCHINLPHDFALRFEEPVAEVWSREVLQDVRHETRDFAGFQSDLVTQVLEWARTQGIRRSTKLLEALVEEVRQHRQKVNAVGKEAVEELRTQVREKLIQRIEGPIRKRCQEFVEARKDAGTGVKNRIVELFEELAEEVIRAASAPATNLLVDKFKVVDQEILTAFGEHSEPLQEAVTALIERRERAARTADAEAALLADSIEEALATIPDGLAIAERTE